MPTESILGMRSVEDGDYWEITIRSSDGSKLVLVPKEHWNAARKEIALRHLDEILASITTEQILTQLGMPLT